MDKHRIFDEPYVVICRKNGKITGYLTFDFVQVDHYTDMYHDLAVRELVCEDMETMKQFLTFFASQTDQIERVRIYTYEEYFHILFTNPDSGENRAYDGAIQETGRKIMGFMFRILDLEEYFRQQSHCDKPVSRAFTLELQVEDDFMESNNKTIRLRVDGDRVCQTDAQKADVILKAKIADLSSLVVGAIPWKHSCGLSRWNAVIMLMCRIYRMPSAGAGNQRIIHIFKQKEGRGDSSFFLLKNGHKKEKL